MTDQPNQHRQVSATRKQRISAGRHSFERELQQKAAQLGLPTRKNIFPEGKLSPSYGDPTAVDDRPFAPV